MKKHPTLAVLVLACLLSAAATAVVCLRLRSDDAQREKYQQIEELVAANYVGEVDWQAVSDAVSAAQIDALGDPWSRYMTAEAYTDYQAAATNQHMGIGITAELDQESHRPVIVAVTAGSPADRAGLEVGNLLLSLGATDLKEVTPAALRELIAGYGTSGFFLMVQNAQGATRTVELSCELVFSSPVSHELTGDGIGYVRLRNFQEGCAENLRAAVDALRTAGARALLFDVRDNPGGILGELLGVLDCLLPAGDLLIQRARNGEEMVYRSDEAGVDLPMAVLINGESHSAAEFFAAVLQEYERAILVGEPTAGKGRSQQTLPLPDGSAVQLSTSYYLTPAGRSLEETGGLTPDIEAEPVESGELDVPRRAAQTALLEALRS